MFLTEEINFTSRCRGPKVGRNAALLLVTDDSQLAPSPGRAHLSLERTEPTRFGSGWISGVLSVALGLAGLGAVFCFHFPSLLTMPALRDLYPLPWVRAT